MDDKIPEVLRSIKDDKVKNNVIETVYMRCLSMVDMQYIENMN